MSNSLPCTRSTTPAHRFLLTWCVRVYVTMHVWVLMWMCVRACVTAAVWNKSIANVTWPSTLNSSHVMQKCTSCTSFTGAFDLMCVFVSVCDCTWKFVWQSVNSESRSWYWYVWMILWKLSMNPHSLSHTHTFSPTHAHFSIAFWLACVDVDVGVGVGVSVVVGVCMCFCVCVYVGVRVCLCECVSLQLYEMTVSRTWHYPIHPHIKSLLYTHETHLMYGVATMSRRLKIIGLFCKRALSKRLYSAKETYNFKEPTNCSATPYALNWDLLTWYICLCQKSPIKEAIFHKRDL